MNSPKTRVQRLWRLALIGGLALLGGCAMLDRAEPPVSAEPSFVQPQRAYRLAIVLSGGALRGFAHVGVLKELRANGIEPDLIVGSSAGAVVGALVASGLSDDEMRDAVSGMHLDFLRDWTVPKMGLFGGRNIHEFVDQRAKHHLIEAYPIAFAAVTVEAQRACLQIFNAGDPGKAAQASATVPVVFSPPRIGSRHYLDGSLMSPLPVRVARALGAERIIAVDVTFDPAERGFVNILEAYWRTTLVMHRALAVNERTNADFVLIPSLPPEYMINFGSRHAMVEAGQEAARRALPTIRNVLATKPAAAPRWVHPSLATMLCPEIELRRLGSPP